MRSLSPKRWVCEDSVLLAPLERGFLAAVADAHWGGLAGEVAMRAALDAWHRAQSRDPAARLRDALYGIEASLKQRGADDSETTVLLAHLRAPMLSWASVGDSLLWVLGRERVVEHNAPAGCFMGQSAIQAPPSFGAALLDPGDVVLLATDGILAATSELEREVIAARLRAPAPSLDLRVEALLRHVSSVGKDNLGVVALQV